MRAAQGGAQSSRRRLALLLELELEEAHQILQGEKDGKPKSAADALADGHFMVRLDGEKLRGGYALQRIGTGKDERWLLIKMRDDAADARRNPVSTEPESVLSGRTVEQVAEGGEAPGE